MLPEVFSVQAMSPQDLEKLKKMFKINPGSTVATRGIDWFSYPSDVKIVKNEIRMWRREKIRYTMAEINNLIQEHSIP